jgi:hypothetical protein
VPPIESGQDQRGQAERTREMNGDRTEVSCSPRPLRSVRDKPTGKDDQSCGFCPDSHLFFYLFIQHRTGKKKYYTGRKISWVSTFSCGTRTV